MNRNLPAWTWTLITIGLVFLIGFIDWMAGYELNFFLSYFIPVSIAAWFIGLPASIVISFLCTIVWFGAELMSGQAYSFYFYFAWNTLVRLVSFLIIGAAIARIRQLHDRQYRLSEDLQRSLTKFVTLYDTTSSAVMLADQKGFLDCNKATLKIFGCANREEFCSRHPADFSPPMQPCGLDSLALSSRYITQVLQKGTSQFEWLHKRADSGETFHANVQLATMVLDGKMIIQAIVRDITAQKRAEDALRQSEAKFREVYENLDDLYFETDAKGMIRLLSPSVYRLTGYKEEELIGKPETAVYANPREKAWLRLKIMLEGSVNDYEILMKNKNGEVASVSLTAHLFYDEKGQPVGVRGLLRNITERKQAEKALQESETKYRRITENMSGIIAEIDALGTIKYLSPSHLRIFGDNPENLIGRTVFDRVHPEDRDRVMTELIEGVRLKTDREAEYRYRHADGHYIWVRSAGNSFYDAEGEFVGAIINTSDITERRGAEEALRQSEAKFREVYENIDDVYFETDAEGNIRFLSPSVYRLTGYKEEEIIGKSVTVIYVHPEENAVLRQKILEEGSVNDYEILVKKKGGAPWYASLTAHLFHDDKGQPVGVRGLLRNITARKLTEEALRQSEARFREVYETIDDMYFQTNPEGNIKDLSPSVCRITGWTEEELIGKHYTFVHANPDDREQLLDKMSQSGHVNDFELLLQKKNGEKFFASLTARRFFDEKGQSIGVRGLLRNITERKKAEERIRHMANHDGLTDLPTLRLANDRLAMAIGAARRDTTKGAVMFMDLDGFKKVNDTLGHDAGDYVLKQVARRLLCLVRETDTVARVGGDEFLLIATRLHTVENTSVLAEKIIKAISEPFIFNGQPAAIGVSIGIALFPDHGEDRDRLIKQADEAMYKIKNSGKNGYRFAGSSR